jgi:DNA-binding beta-propeller fold protein YncE
MTFVEGAPWRVVPSADESKLFLMLKYSTFGYAFVVYDVATDSIIFSDPLTPGAGDIEITRSGRYAFYSNPGTIAVGPPPPSHFKVFDVRNNEICQIVSTEEVTTDSSGYMPIGLLAITPDGTRLVALRGPVGNEFLVLNPIDMRIEDYHHLGYSTWLFDVTCQNGL